MYRVRSLVAVAVLPPPRNAVVGSCVGSCVSHLASKATLTSAAPLTATAARPRGRSLPCRSLDHQTAAASWAISASRHRGFEPSTETRQKLGKNSLLYCTNLNSGQDTRTRANHRTRRTTSSSTQPHAKQQPTNADKPHVHTQSRTHTPPDRRTMPIIRRHHCTV